MRKQFMLFNDMLKNMNTWFTDSENGNSEVTQESIQIARVMEDFIGALRHYLVTNTRDEDRWWVFPGYSFDGKFDLTEYPEIAEMYLGVAEVSHLLYRIYHDWNEKLKALEYLKLYKGIIMVLSYYQGIFATPDNSQVDLPKKKMNC